MKPPSEKQMKYARRISRGLQIELPKEDTAKAYFDFIKEHHEEYQSWRDDMESLQYDDLGPDFTQS